MLILVDETNGKFRLLDIFLGDHHTGVKKAQEVLLAECEENLGMSPNYSVSFKKIFSNLSLPEVSSIAVRCGTA